MDTDDILDEKTYETRKLIAATFIQRSSAFLLDVILFFILSYGFHKLLRLAPYYIQFLTNYWMQLLILIALYYIYFDGGENNATLGKQIIGIRLLNEQKQAVSYFVSAQHFFSSVILFFGYFIQLGNEKRQTLADKYCKVLVVNV
ncbi:MAG: RDD family protein [Bacteroidetes bacterium]|nr:RDD family protein [Bacteroidota bacterium]